MALIKREDIAVVRERVRIDEVVGTYVTLKPAGVGSMKGLCPFHDERTPSFHVRPQLGLWHCFGCDEGGDVISFVQRIDHLPFAEAVEHLAAQAGVPLHYEEDGKPRRAGEEPGRRQRLLEANRAAEEYFREQLATPEAAIGRRFLAERGFDRAASEHFGVGYARQGWDHLLRHLRGKGFTEAEISTSGLVSQGNRGHYDRFRGRLIWPIRDLTGATIGFGARKLYDDDPGPKYLNTPETPLYKKSQVLYGIDLSKREIAKARQVVVVEGYTDVMAAHLAGISTAVATCGTAFGSDHVRIVRRLLGDRDDAAAGVMLSTGGSHGGEVVFTFDGDAAGQKAALRAFEEDQQFAAQTFVAIQPDGLDPCDLRLRQGDGAVRDLVSTRQPLFAFAIRSVLAQVDLGTAEGRVAALRSAGPVVAQIRDRALRGEYTRSLAGWLGMDEVDVRRAVQAAERQRGRGAPADGIGPDGPGGHRQAYPSGAPQERREADPHQRGSRESFREDPVAQLERRVLEVVLQLPHFALAAGFDDIAPDTFTMPAYRGVHDAIRAAGGARAYGQQIERLGGASDAGGQAMLWWAEELRTNAVGPVAGVLTELAVAPLPEDRSEALAGYARGVVLALRRMSLTRQIADVKGELQRTEPDDPRYHELFASLMDMETRRRGLAEEA
ncbi:DNA primase [Bogoriella caseilytica]|uniref:DNA primase n=1 Tax=Bogoriella caseilytica TaxID=56055 RepID=A0A3N2BFS3_9MICO|nr:DNA primase [Bogoriella caseilytica]ROR74113.1 DNA primase [Bogoriella caseilytica]